MNILVIYGTTEGQTRKIAGFIADRLRACGKDAVLVDSTAIPESLDVDSFDGIIAAGSVHNDRHQASLFQFVCDHRSVLQTKPSALISVSLSMAGTTKEDRLDAAASANRFIQAAEWTPTITHLVAGALRYTQYDFFKRWMFKMIAGAKGASTDTNKDHEFTDWNDLEGFVDTFIEAVTDHPKHPTETSPHKSKLGSGDPVLFAEDKKRPERRS